ncbi:D-tyrosyl-tRNA(Tyr) deacylase, partial [Staphylococcus epidermidis]|nr:D-tyrosyl-tRNA(Tyr) deacylase [Staphylococcus epidermidis]
MKIIVQRVKNARVTNDTIDNQINKGNVSFVGVGQNFNEAVVKGF